MKVARDRRQIYRSETELVSSTDSTYLSTCSSKESIVSIRRLLPWPVSGERFGRAFWREVVPSTNHSDPSIWRFHGITESRGGLMDFPRAGHVGINTDYKPRSTSYR